MMRHCDSCRAAPGHVYCRADAAVLCVSCDADIHSANLISHRHHRVPVMFVGVHDEVYVDDEEVGANGRCDYEALFGEEVDEYLDLGEFGVCDESNNQGQKQGVNLERVKSEGSEGVVPVVGNEDYQDINYTAQPSHRVPLSSIEVNSVVHHHTTVTQIADAYIRPSKGTIELFSAPVPLQLPAHFSHTDREARVLRYREKKKTRKFEKTIRYASRKAYAEARPRIKGRFAKRSEVELEVDQMFSNYVDVSEDGYGIVPSF